MKKLLLSALTAVFLCAPAGMAIAQPPDHGGPGMHGEMAMHPRIQAAIASLNDAIDYLQAAPHNFGGHKMSAIKACKKAVWELQKAMQYRERKDMR